MDTITSNDGTRLAYQQSGVGPPLVLVHGTTGSSATWTPILAALEEHFSIYALDRRGRGDSGDAPSYAIEREFEDVASVVDSIGQPVNLLGHSFGGLCALEAALLTPHIRKLILYESPIPVEGIPIYPEGVIDRLDALFAAGDRDGVLTTLYREVVRMPAHEFESLRASPDWPIWAATTAHTIPRELRAAAGYRFSADRFGGLDIPTLLMVGGDSPALFPEATKVLEAALPKSRVVVLPGQQHIAIDTAPDLFAHEVISFLTEPA